MANEEHLTIIKQGVDVWNEWRNDNPKIIPDLSEAYFNKAALSKANLKGVNLSEVRLIMANLRSADLSGSNLTGANLREADLRNADLRNADLIHADLSNAGLSHADLSNADLSHADLSNANLIWATLIGTILIKASLGWAHLTWADLSRANLSQANLSGANLSMTNLSETDWRATKLGHTTFGYSNLSQAKGLESVEHRGPSSIGIDTIYLSGGNIPEVFLRGAGVPDNFIAYMKSLTGQALEFYSCFICYSSRDNEFVERLYADLQANGVRCWYAPEDLKIGEPFVLGIEEGIRLHEKLLLVLSENSVASNWVQHEVLSAMAKEQGKEPWVLFPIRVDNAVMETSVLWASMIRQSRHIGDFSQWKDHDSYRKAFDRLLRDLKASE